MSALQSGNLLLRFILELVGLAAVGYWGYSLPTPAPIRWAMAIATPLAIAVLWAFVVAPKSAIGLSPDIKRWIGTAVLLAAAGALAATRRPALAAILATVIITNSALMQIWEQ